MKTIVLSLEYGCSPVWVYDNERLIDNGLPLDLSNHADLEAALLKMQSIYENGFFNSDAAFDGKPFSPSEKEAIQTLLTQIMCYLKVYADGYQIINRIRF